jgi:sorbitol-specific phosphotransferase system component IIA
MEHRLLLITFRRAAPPGFYQYSYILLERMGRRAIAPRAWCLDA